MSARQRRGRQSGVVRDRQLLVKLTAAEEQEIRAAAGRSSMTAAEYLLASARQSGQRVERAAEAADEMVAIRRLLGNIANNVNQVAAAVNSGQPLPDSWLVVLDAVRDAAIRTATAAAGVRG